MAEEKRRLREALRARPAVSPEAAERAGHAVAERVLALLGAGPVARFGLYAALPDELPSEPLFEALRARGLRCAFPRCRDDGRLEFADVGRFDELRSGRYGVREPVAAAEPLGPEDWLVVPGVAFDAHGGRLGRGRAYYDRTFPVGREAPRWVGVAFSAQCVERVPCEPHDRRVDALITETDTRVFDGETAGR